MSRSFRGLVCECVRARPVSAAVADVFSAVTMIRPTQLVAVGQACKPTRDHQWDSRANRRPSLAHGAPPINADQPQPREMVNGGSGASVEEQDLSEINSCNALLGRYPLHQLGDLGGELNRKVFKPFGTTKQADPGDYLS